MSDLIERSMKEFDKQFNEKFSDISFVKKTDIEDLQAGVKKLCNRIDALKTENAELKAINKEMYEALEAIAVKLDIMRPINPFEYGEIRDEIINDIKVLHKTRGEINNDQS